MSKIRLKCNSAQRRIFGASKERQAGSSPVESTDRGLAGGSVPIGSEGSSPSSSTEEKP